MFKGIDFYSDTHTRPTPSMRQKMIQAEVGDEQIGEDPTTLKLQETVAETLGLEAAIFFPSATMANEVAIQLHCSWGDELIAAENCHLYVAESGGPAKHANVLCRSIPTKDGTFDEVQLEEKITKNRGLPHFPISRMVSVENTTNLGGGIAWPLDKLSRVLEKSEEHSLKTHLDGARLFNASVRSGQPVRELCKGFDSVTLCLSKGLGCPAGAVLAFKESQREKVRRIKQLMGGALRQSGMLAAAGLYALENHVNRLADDHKHAQLLANAISDIPQLKIENPEPSTNMVFFSWSEKYSNPDTFEQACISQGLRFSRLGPNRFRAVTHLDIQLSDLETGITILKQVCSTIQ